MWCDIDLGHDDNFYKHSLKPNKCQELPPLIKARLVSRRPK